MEEKQLNKMILKAHDNLTWKVGKKKIMNRLRNSEPTETSPDDDIGWDWSMGFPRPWY